MQSSSKPRASPPSSYAGSRSTTPRPIAPQPPSGPTNDHTLSDFRHRLSQREYPPDCPPLNVRWYYAVDVPKRKPFSNGQTQSVKKPLKFLPFTPHDSKAIETAFQKLSAEEDAAEATAYSRHGIDAVMGGDLGDLVETKKSGPEDERNWKVAVNEDYLFDVDLKTRELAPVYWLGPVYEVLRGTWFYQEGSSLRPCTENLATQIEEGYLKIKPWRSAPTDKKIGTVAMPGSATIGTAKDAPAAPQPLQTWRLFGAHLNSFIVFADINTAYLLTDDFYGKLSATVWQRITAGTHMGGTKIVRGFTETAKVPEKKNEKEIRSATPPPSERGRTSAIDEDKRNRRKSMPPPATSTPVKEEKRDLSRAALERKMSTYGADTEMQEEMLEAEMKEDYRADQEGDEQGREIEHLILVTHGIGQKLGLRTESVNFVHDVNVFRKSLKGVYGHSPDLQVLNSETESKTKNCRVQCLPVCWRHMLEFPKQSLRQNRGEHDLSSGSTGYEDEYPSLEDITVEGVPSIRNLMTDLALDVLLYQSSTYREHIIQTVRTECNRIFALFKQRNPGFKGKVSLVGHSLGSAILFDILCRQPNDDFYERSRSKRAKLGDSNVLLDFPVENLFCLGSPVGLFQMLKGRTIASRKHANSFMITPSALDQDFAGESFTASTQTSSTQGFPVSSPKCTQLFNIFHPSDPISYRIEPLVSKAMSDLKAQPLPYTKRGLFSSNGQIVGGISGIGQSVTRSVSNMWSSLSSGIASSILNRSLGIDGSSTPPSSGSGPIPSTEKNAPVSAEGQHPPTMIDAEIETLYSGFQKRRKTEGEKAREEDVEQEGWRLHKEEEKVRALNDTGRIDFAIQEGVFDISLIASIASHLSYWSDEDVNHFVISQLLSRQRVIKRKKASGRAGLSLGENWSVDIEKN